MVKGDPKRDYYADLNLNSNVDSEQIKKAYRELARLYHPDRNRGSEVDVVPKFQAIQAAHEILGDPESRQKYDEQRRRLGFGARAPTAARPKPYSAYTTGDPRRPPPRPDFATRPSAGASRFESFNVPPRSGPRPKTGSREDAQARADAWTYMHHAKSHEQPSRPPPPRPDPRPYTSAYEGMNARRGSFGRSASTRVPKPGGFDPRAKQDEPPASGSAYFTQSRFSSRQQPPPPPAAKTTGFGASKSATATPTSRKSTEDPFAGGRSQHASDEAPFAEGRDRPRAPYTSQPGEKFNIFGEGMKRSSSVRASPGRAHVSSDTSDRTSREATPESRARHRSASPSARSAYNPIPTKPASQPRKKPPPPSARYSSYSSTSSEDSSGPDYPSNLGPGARHVHPGAGRSSDPETARRKSEGHATERKMASPGGFWKRGTKPNGEAGSGTMPGGPTAGAAPVPGQASSEGGTGSNKPIFNIPSFSQSQSARGPADTARHARSEESINTTFSPSEWSGKFEGNPDYFAPPPTAPKVRKDSTTSAHRSPTRSRSASRPSAPGTPKPAETAQMPPPPIPPVPQSPLRTTPSGNLQFPAAPGEKRFKPELWNETKGWDFQPPDSLEKKPSSPTKGPRNGRVSEHDRRAKGPNVEDVRDEELGGGGIGIGVNANHADATPAQEEGGRASRTSSGGASVDAMDIDTEPPFMTPQPPQPQMHMPNGIARELSGSTAASPTPARAPRLVSQPTQRPDWSDVKNRTYQAYMNQVNGTSTHPTLQQSPRPTSSGFPVDQPLPPPPPGPPPSVRTSTGKKLPKSRRPPVNLADLQNVSPFTTTAGLEGLADLNTTLPFPSRPSSSHPTAPTATLPLSLPAPPRAPPPPPHLTQSSWTQYYERMGAYMGEWSNFNNTMLGHFAARQSALANVIEISKGPHRASWLGQVGDGREGGFESYMRGMKEDERVSTHWNVAKEKHREAVEEFAGVRGKVVAAFGRGVV